MNYPRLVLFFLLLISPQFVFAQKLEELSTKLTGLDTRINALNDEYKKEEKTNGERLEKIEVAKRGNNPQLLDQELKVAYASAEKLSQINMELNRLNEDKKANCRLWQAAYRQTIDELLALAVKEKDQKKRGQIGRKLEAYQKINARLCPVGLEIFLSQDWRQLQIQSYDGPQEIRQKVSLLQDLSREIKIRLAHLENYYQESILERKIKERAQEFIQEGTLFDSSNIRTSRGTAGDTSGGTTTSSERPDTGFSHGPTGNPNGGTIGETAGNTNTPHEVGSTDWSSYTVEQIEIDYSKLKKDLLNQQTELQKKITDFEKQATTLLKQ